MIRMNDQVRKMIIEKRDAAYIREHCIQTGMSTMLDDGIEKILNGITSLDEVVRVIRE
jgi:type II secretory ATPase GspE/PulE/Tfp pilus assembly ATPase PilB-like protein